MRRDFVTRLLNWALGTIPVVTANESSETIPDECFHLKFTFIDLAECAT